MVVNRRSLIVTTPTEVSHQFMQGMADRMAVSYHKYGAVAEAYPVKVDAIESLKDRLFMYRRTGNTEWLIDAANFCMIEFMCPAHENAHFESTDSDASPGRSVTFSDTSQFASNREIGS
jgi:hypothetical protein